MILLSSFCMISFIEFRFLMLFRIMINLLLFNWEMVLFECKYCFIFLVYLIKSLLFILWLSVLLIFLKLLRFKNIIVILLFFLLVVLMVNCKWFNIRFWLGSFVKELKLVCFYISWFVSFFLIVMLVICVNCLIKCIFFVVGIVFFLW